MEKAKLATDTFNNNFNCAQSVFAAFSEELGLDKESAFRIASCFGGGMRCGEACGAVTGALMAIGLKNGYDQQNDVERKANANRLASQFIEKFKETNGSIICRELLGYDLSRTEEMQKIKELNLFKTICPKMVADAVAITQNII